MKNLREQMLHYMQLKNYSKRTIDTLSFLHFMPEQVLQEDSGNN